MSAPVYVWRLDRDGLAHLCHKGYTNTLCGTYGRQQVDTGVPCPRCLELAAEAAA